MGHSRNSKTSIFTTDSPVTMSVPREKYLSPVWKDGLFKNKVLFCTGGAGTICSMQVRAFVALGGNACVIGRNPQKTEQGAKDIAAVRPGAKVIGIGNVDVRDPKMLKDAADRCAKELGGIDFAIAGAAGNFLAPMAQLSPNAFKSVMDRRTWLLQYRESRAPISGRKCEAQPQLRQVWLGTRHWRQDDLRLCDIPLQRATAAGPRGGC